jgi:hypothetical protein
LYCSRIFKELTSEKKKEFMRQLAHTTGFIVNNFDIKPSHFPLAKDRIANTSRNIIDTAALETMVLQCHPIIMD